ncbi:MAG: uroporphyrinogen-III synthase [Planctomycetaceae bacterium]
MTQQGVPVVCSFESRRADVMGDMIRRFGGQPMVAPSMKELPIDDNPEGVAALNRLLSGELDFLILLTGVGIEAMLQLAESQNVQDQLLQAMSRLPLLTRGPKPDAVLQRLGLKPAVRAAAPNTSDDLLEAISIEGITLRGTTVGVQEYGQPNPELYAALEERGASVVPIPVYRWALPDNTEPLKRAIRSVAAGDVDVLLFTSAQQVRHVLQVADRLSLSGQFRERASAILTASIGPTCSDAIRDAGLPVHLEAMPPKMGVLVRAALLAFRDRCDGDSP